MIRRNNLIRYISLLLVITFLGSDLAHAAPENLASIVLPPNPLQVIVSDPSRFEAPLEFAELKEIHKGSKDKLLILFQDAHSNFSGQENLAKSLDTMMGRYGLSLILSEGGVGDSTLTDLKKLAPSDTWKRIAKNYLIEGRLAGEEYLNLTSDHPMTIMGIEDLPLYVQSLQSYAKLATGREASLTELEKVQYAVNKIKKKYYPKEILVYEEKGKVLEGGGRRAEGGKELDSLLELAQKSGVDYAPFSNVLKLVELKLDEKLIDFNLANLELEALVQKLEKLGGGGRVREWAKERGRLKTDRVAQFSLFQNIFNMAKEKNIALKDSPNLVQYAEYLKKFSNLDLDELLGETEKFEDEAYKKILSDRDALLLRSIDRYLGLLRNAYKIQMTSKEFDAFLANEPDFSTPACLAFLNRKLMDEGFFSDVVEHTSTLEDGKVLLKAFYDSVSRRDLAFVENTRKQMENGKLKMEDKEFSQFSIFNSPSRAAVLIAGGYHTQHLKELFAKEGYSIIVLAPKVTTETNQAKYEKLLLAPIRKEVKVVQTGAREYESGTQGIRVALNLTAARIARQLGNAAPFTLTDLETAAIGGNSKAAARLAIESRDASRLETVRFLSRAFGDYLKDVSLAQYAVMNLFELRDRLALIGYDPYSAPPTASENVDYLLRNSKSLPAGEKKEIDRLLGKAQEHTEEIKIQLAINENRGPGAAISDGERQAAVIFATAISRSGINTRSGSEKDWILNRAEARQLFALMPYLSDRQIEAVIRHAQAHTQELFRYLQQFSQGMASEVWPADIRQIAKLAVKRLKTSDKLRFTDGSEIEITSPLAGNSYVYDVRISVENKKTEALGIVRQKPLLKWLHESFRAKKFTPRYFIQVRDAQSAIDGGAKFLPVKDSGAIEQVNRWLMAIVSDGEPAQNTPVSDDSDSFLWKPTKMAEGARLAKGGEEGKGERGEEKPDAARLALPGILGEHSSEHKSATYRVIGSLGKVTFVTADEFNETSSADQSLRIANIDDLVSLLPDLGGEYSSYSFTAILKNNDGENLEMGVFLGAYTPDFSEEPENLFLNFKLSRVGDEGRVLLATPTTRFYLIPNGSAPQSRQIQTQWIGVRMEGWLRTHKFTGIEVRLSGSPESREGYLKRYRSARSFFESMDWVVISEDQRTMGKNFTPAAARLARKNRRQMAGDRRQIMQVPDAARLATAQKTTADLNQILVKFESDIAKDFRSSQPRHVNQRALQRAIKSIYFKSGRAGLHLERLIFILGDLVKHYYPGDADLRAKYRDRIETEVMPLLKDLGNELAVVLPTANEWLSFYTMFYIDGNYTTALYKLAELVDPMTLAKRFALFGPHLRQYKAGSDYEDEQGILIILPKLMDFYKGLTGKVEDKKSKVALAVLNGLIYQQSAALTGANIGQQKDLLRKRWNLHFSHAKPARGRKAMASEMVVDALQHFKADPSSPKSFLPLARYFDFRSGTVSADNIILIAKYNRKNLTYLNLDDVVFATPSSKKFYRDNDQTRSGNPADYNGYQIFRLFAQWAGVDIKGWPAVRGARLADNTTDHWRDVWKQPGVNKPQLAYPGTPERGGLFIDGYPPQVLNYVLDGLRNITDASVVVDVGSGADAFLAQKILNQHPGLPEITLLDVIPAEEMRPVVRENRRLRYVQASAEATTLASGSVDYIISTFMLEYQKDMNAVLDEFRRSLKKGGKLILVTHSYYSSPVLSDTAAGSANADKLSSMRVLTASELAALEVSRRLQSNLNKLYSPQTIRDFFEAAGFQVVDLKNLEDSYGLTFAQALVLTPKPVSGVPGARLAEPEKSPGVFREFFKYVFILGLLMAAAAYYFRGKSSPSLEPNKRAIPVFEEPLPEELLSPDEAPSTLSSPRIDYEPISLKTIRDPNLRMWTEHIQTALGYLQISEKILAPELEGDDLDRRIQALLLGNLMIWRAENPQNRLVQIDDGPAGGVYQVEGRSAIDEIKGALSAPRNDPRNILVKKFPLSEDLLSRIRRLNSQSGKDSRQMRDLLAAHPDLQFLTWRLYILSKFEELPSTTERWTFLHAQIYNTAYYLDLEDLNSGAELKRVGNGLTIPGKVWTIGLLARRIHTLSPKQAVQYQDALALKLKATEADLNQFLSVYYELTRALRQVRDSEKSLRGLESELKKNRHLPDKSEQIRKHILSHIDRLRKLNESTKKPPKGSKEKQHNDLFVAKYKIENLRRSRMSGLSNSEQNEAHKYLKDAFETIQSGADRLIEKAKSLVGEEPSGARLALGELKGSANKAEDKEVYTITGKNNASLVMDIRERIRSGKTVILQVLDSRNQASVRRYEVLEIRDLHSYVYKVRVLDGDAPGEKGTVRALKIFVPRRKGERAVRYGVVQRLMQRVAATAPAHLKNVFFNSIPHPLQRFIEMDYVEGVPLGEAPYAQWKEAMLSLAETIAFLHRNGVFHGDIQPANVLRARDGSIRLIDFEDFGVVSQGEDRVVRFVDIQAMGDMLYEMSTGRDSLTDSSYLDAIMPGGTGKISWRPEDNFSEDIKTNIERALFAGKGNGYRSATEFYEDLKRAIGLTAKGERPAARLAKSREEDRGEREGEEDRGKREGEEDRGEREKGKLNAARLAGEMTDNSRQMADGRKLMAKLTDAAQLAAKSEISPSGRNDNQPILHPWGVNRFAETFGARLTNAAVKNSEQLLLSEKNLLDPLAGYLVYLENHKLPTDQKIDFEFTGTGEIATIGFLRDGKKVSVQLYDPVTLAPNGPPIELTEELLKKARAWFEMGRDEPVSAKALKEDVEASLGPIYEKQAESINRGALGYLGQAAQSPEYDPVPVDLRLVVSEEFEKNYGEMLTEWVRTIEQLAGGEARIQFGREKNDFVTTQGYRVVYLGEFSKEMLKMAHEAGVSGVPRGSGRNFLSLFVARAVFSILVQRLEIPTPQLQQLWENLRANPLAVLDPVTFKKLRTVSSDAVLEEYLGLAFRVLWMTIDATLRSNENALLAVGSAA